MIIRGSLMPMPIPQSVASARVRVAASKLIASNPNPFAAGAIGIGLWLGAAMPAFAQAPPVVAREDTPADPASRAIRQVLDEQAAAWNRGDLDGFLAGYWRSPRVVFQSGGTRYDGFDAMRDRYRQRYGADGRAMGQLAFSGLEIEPLGPEAAFVRGRYTLTMADGTHPTGLFTLILRRFGDGWKITHDHTSAAEAAPTAPPPGGSTRPANSG